MHNDEPTLLDLLDRKQLIEEVGDAIAHCTPPQVFGVHGDWGLGKTSFLHQVQWYLTGECPQQSEEAIEETKDSNQISAGKYKETIRAVWFDAWRYQHEEAPVVALLQEMRAQLSWGHQIIDQVAKRGIETTVRGALHSIEGLTKQIGFQYSKFRDANREWEARNLAVSLPSHTLRQHLSKAIDQLLPQPQPHADVNQVTPAPASSRPRVAVFIDDVDRCEPEAAYRLLEGLKIYLALDNCVFILGMNQKAVEDAIGSRMDIMTDKIKMASKSGERQVQARAAAYMEKLCQNVWRLPAVRAPGQILHDLLEKTVKREAVRDRIRQAVAMYPCLPPNPRRLKGLANLIGRLSSRLPAEVDANPEAAIVEAQLLVIVAYIYQFHPELYVRWESEPSLYDRILDWCRHGKSDTSFLRSLVLPVRTVEDDTAATPKPETESTYPDPTETSVFWIQPLILSLGAEVTAEQFGHYLHGRTT